MSIVKSEFALALNQVATERGISPDDVLDSIEAAILAAYKKEASETTGQTIEELPETITVKLNRDTGEAHILDAEKDITPPGFGRIAAQTAKQVILQKIREAEKKTVITHYKSQVGTVTRGRVIRYDGYNAFVDIGKVEAILPRDEQVRSEKYTVNDSFLFYIKEIGEDKFGNSKIIISRTDPALIAELFKREVPEVASGTVEIKKVVREPGERAKIAVYSEQQGVDPVGACVGQKGVRVQTVTNEFGGKEKIDIIQFARDEKLFIMAALSPAKITDIELDAKIKKARVSVTEDQTPLAIGKNGVNVNLASRLTGYEIDIIQIKSDKPAEEAAVEKPKEEVKEEIKEEPQEPASAEAVTVSEEKAGEEQISPAEEPTPAEPPAPQEEVAQADQEQPVPQEAESAPQETQTAPEPSQFQDNTSQQQEEKA